MKFCKVTVGNLEFCNLEFGKNVAPFRCIRDECFGNVDPRATKCGVSHFYVKHLRHVRATFAVITASNLQLLVQLVPVIYVQQLIPVIYSN
jgi:hypothetical protein